MDNSIPTNFQNTNNTINNNNNNTNNNSFMTWQPNLYAPSIAPNNAYNNTTSNTSRSLGSQYVYEEMTPNSFSTPPAAAPEMYQHVDSNNNNNNNNQGPPPPVNISGSQHMYTSIAHLNVESLVVLIEHIGQKRWPWYRNC
ncbi:hypothetical protein AKO1_001802 [Acrasis kona]|uniref:Uncharacterized protein n=1 Tax=Acrasis kona TaxID=1008807 RepID=A0AAW2Z9N3_9EUKA